MNNQSISPISIAKSLALSAFTASVMFSASQAQAEIFNVGVTNYDITIIDGSYNSLKTQLEATPWWNNYGLAQNVANVVRDSLGTPNIGDPNLRYDMWGNPFMDVRGPWFAFSTSFLAGGPSVDRVEGVYLLDAGVGAFAGSQLQSRYGNFAIATSAVPEPLTILGSITAAGFGVAFKRKKNNNKE